MDRADGRDGFCHNANPNYVMAGCLGLGYRVARDIFIQPESAFHAALGYTFSDLSTSRA